MSILEAENKPEIPYFKPEEDLNNVFISVES
jgi:hypothetical protein